MFLRKKYLLLSFLGFAYFNLQAQVSLEYLIGLAQKNSLVIQAASNDLKLANLNDQTFKLSNKPSLVFNGNVPAYNKDNYAVTQPDGSLKFLPRSQNYSNIGIGFSQPISFTGGSIAVNTDLYRFDNFTTKTKQYNGAPFFVRLSQPLFGFNSYKWDKKINNFQLQEATQLYKETSLQLAYTVSNLFFNILEAQEETILATANHDNTITNLAIEKRRVQLGVSTEDKVLQLEIQLLTSILQLSSAELAKRKAQGALNLLLNMNDTIARQLLLPRNVSVYQIDKEKMLLLVKEILPYYKTQQRKIAEGERKNEQAKKEGRQIDLTASFGFNNTADRLENIYRNPQDQQRVSIGLSIPVADWGRRKNKMAIAAIEQEKLGIEQKKDEASLIDEIVNLIDELPSMAYSIKQAEKIDTLTQQRFAITNRLYQLSKASLLELQAAQNEMESARRSFVHSLRVFWEAYYLLKVKTLVEF